MRYLLFELSSIIGLTLIVFFLQPNITQYLAFSHTALKDFEFWRLITATFCHTNFNHLLMNISGLLVTIFLFIDTFKKTKLWPLILFNSVLISTMIFFLDPKILWYVGLSGVLHGLFSYAVCSDLIRKDRWGYILGFAIIVKISFEQFHGAEKATMLLINAPVLINAHLYGAISGIIFFILQKNIKICRHKYLK